MRADSRRPAGESRQRRHDACAAAGRSRARDGVVQGFTDHDDAILTARRRRLPRRRPGFPASEATAQLGLAVDGVGDRRRARRRRLERGRSRRRALRRGAASRCISSTGASPRCACCCARACSARCGARGPAFAAELRGLARSARRGERTALHRDLRRRSRRCALPVDLDDPAFRGSGAVASLDGTSTFLRVGPRRRSTTAGSPPAG